MSRLPTLDLVVLALYTGGVVLLGSAFFRRSRTPKGFTAAGGALPQWAVGLSLFGTYLSSNTFLGVPGRAYASNWNAFVFSLSLPFAAWVATRYFIPFYRRTGEISAYTHLERRFGPWARMYAMVCYLLTQVARMGSILFGVAIALTALTGWPMGIIIVATGAVVTLYTLLGGIEAVIWTDVAQSVILCAGAVVVVVMLFVGMPGGPGQLFAIANDADKFSLGSYAPDFTMSTVWVVLLYGLFINLNNFGIDQSFVQRYHTARSDRQAARSVWLAAGLYIPISLLFFIIGSGLFAYYEAQPQLKETLETRLAAQAGLATPSETEPTATTSEDLADHVFPDFIVQRLPPGLSGLVIAALLAAAMSSLDTSLNSSATVILFDLYRGWLRRSGGDAEAMRILYGGTLVMGALGVGTALAMIGVKSLLDAWWTLSGIFAGGVLGLFLLGFISRRADRPAAVSAVVIGVLVIFWMTLSPRLPADSPWRNPLHTNMVIVAGTLAIFLVGVLFTKLRARR
jgi:SSS family solute:Na+ symporter